MKISDIEGIGPSYAEKLKAAGIDTVEELLKGGASSAQRDDLEIKTGISGKLILEWVNMADLIRINGLGPEYVDLLEEAGVDSVPELAQRNADNLHAKMTEVNAAKNLVNRLPSADQVEKWVAEAKTLDKIVTH